MSNEPGGYLRWQNVGKLAVYADYRSNCAGYLFAAFTVIWVLVFGYVLSLFNRQRRLRREINLLKEALEKKETELASK